MLGCFEEVIGSYNVILKWKFVDVLFFVVVINNLIVFKGFWDFFDFLKKMEKLLEKKDVS